MSAKKSTRKIIGYTFEGHAIYQKKDGVQKPKEQSPQGDTAPDKLN